MMMIDTGWWFGTFFIFQYSGNFIIPIDVHIFSEGWLNHQPAMMFFVAILNSLIILNFVEFSYGFSWWLVGDSW